MDQNYLLLRIKKPNIIGTKHFADDCLQIPKKLPLNLLNMEYDFYLSFYLMIS